MASNCCLNVSWLSSAMLTWWGGLGEGGTGEVGKGEGGGRRVRMEKNISEAPQKVLPEGQVAQPRHGHLVVVERGGGRRVGGKGVWEASGRKGSVDIFWIPFMHQKQRPE
ncbi:unnamed protein product, partial [Closterium sp. NIES-53]